MSKIIRKKDIEKNIRKELVTLHSISFGDVERGEKVFRLEKIGETDAVSGEITFQPVSLDDDISKGSRLLGNGRVIKVRDVDEVVTHKFENFDSQPEEVVNSEIDESGFVDSFSEPEEAAEEPPVVVAGFTQEEMDEAVAQARALALEEGRQAGFGDGHAKGFAEGESAARQSYEAAKSDYMAQLQKTYTETLAKADAFGSAVGELDTAVPDMVMSFVEDLIGIERKINRKLAVSVVQKNIDTIMNLSKIIFKVNPADVEEMQKAFPEQQTIADSSILMGGVKIETNIGEINYTIETILENFEKHFYEELETSEEH